MDNGEILRSVGLLEGVSGRKLNPAEMDTVISWITDYNYNSELCEFAIECTARADRQTFGLIRWTIENWYRAGVKDIDNAKIYQKMRHAENLAKYLKKEIEGIRTVRLDIPLDLYRELEKVTHKNDLSFNSMVIKLLTDAMSKK